MTVLTETRSGHTCRKISLWENLLDSNIVDDVEAEFALAMIIITGLFSTGRK